MHIYTRQILVNYHNKSLLHTLEPSSRLPEVPDSLAILDPNWIARLGS